VPRVSVAILLLASCAAKHEQSAPALAVQDEPAWRAKLTEQRAEKDRDFATSATSVLAAVDRFAPTTTASLAVDGDEVRMSEQPGPTTLITFQPVDPTHWTWQQTVPEVVATTSDGKQSAAPGAISEPTRFRLSTRFHAVAQLANGELVITAFDAKRKQFVEFSKLTYFDADPRFVVTAKLERLDKPVTLNLTTNRGLTKPFVRYATLRFELDGQPCTLTAFRFAGSTTRNLFIPFRDATSGKETYGAARFLDVEESDGRPATVTLDFNEAYNPYCAYSPGYNCPIPPPENHLRVAVTAGERTYAH
jgi:uncharacterized protein (DUF1684 family)